MKENKLTYLGMFATRQQEDMDQDDSTVTPEPIVESSGTSQETKGSFEQDAHREIPQEHDVMQNSIDDALSRIKTLLEGADKRFNTTMNRTVNYRDWINDQLNELDKQEQELMQERQEMDQLKQDLIRMVHEL